MTLPVPLEGLLPLLFRFPLGDLKLRKNNNGVLFSSYLNEIFTYWYGVITNQAVVVGMSEYFDSHQDFWSLVRSGSLEVGMKSDALFQCYCSMGVLGKSLDMEALEFERFKEISCTWVISATKPQKPTPGWNSEVMPRSIESISQQVRSLTCL